MKTTLTKKNKLETLNFTNSFVLSRREINASLDFYSNEHIYVTSAILMDSNIEAYFRKFPFPFLKKPPRHLTREQAVLFITQASYLLALNMKKLNPKWSFSNSFGKRLANTEQMAFSSIEIWFKKYLLNNDGIKLNLSFGKCRILNSIMHLPIEFNFGENCYGSCQGIIALDESFKIEE